MPDIHIRISNLPQIRAAFIRAPAGMTKNLNLAIKKAALAIQSKSMINTPVLTGRLRVSHSSLFDNLKATIQTNTDYAIYVHEGTRFMKARPFLAQAVAGEANRVDDYFRKAVQDTLDDIARAT